MARHTYKSLGTPYNTVEGYACLIQAHPPVWHVRTSGTLVDIWWRWTTSTLLTEYLIAVTLDILRPISPRMHLYALKVPETVPEDVRLVTGSSA